MTRQLKLQEVATVIVNRTVADPHTAITVAISRARLSRQEEGEGPLIAFPNRPSIQRSQVSNNRDWLVNPIVDIEASTLQVPVSVPGTWNQLRSEMQPTVILLFEDDVDRLWPPPLTIEGVVSEALRMIRAGEVPGPSEAAKALVKLVPGKKEDAYTLEALRKRIERALKTSGKRP